LPLRRFLMWIGLNIGRQRANFFGTFGLSVYSALGAESLRPLAPCTVVLNWGVINADGIVDVRFNYDHRVMDGATVARALQALEKILAGAIVDEVNAWR
jgi:pyruvate/2-oxoglutarate dehydrogenase complex dihydrolipoamide acyltransferase (E2) component